MVEVMLVCTKNPAMLGCLLSTTPTHPHPENACKSPIESRFSYGRPNNQKQMDVSPVPAISYVKDFNCHIGTIMCFWLFGFPGKDSIYIESIDILGNSHSMATPPPTILMPLNSPMFPELPPPVGTASLSGAPRHRPRGW